ncbi:hypothetical protein JOF53_001973 [Crossiella equi]|uniref:F5/8 type C domain-containing protein n=1 Tax=Crossiella equi TaxID=130796 RepID=A0ABS5A955_9PSEU|nr:discoidin domain-containing protein [Crossiella equi]MBP2473101.1 hypothetical protein [Crossiella equi]
MSTTGTRRSPRFAAAVGTAAALLLPALAPTAVAAPAAPAGAAAVRTAMTWSVLGQRGGYTHVGRDATTNAYTGDTAIDAYLPVLCLAVDNQAAPSGITFDSGSGWARGTVRATAPVRGDVLTSQAAGDALCTNVFGAGHKLAEFHDGRYGPGFGSASGWSFWAAGQLTPGTRFWVAINDQPANPWNAEGTLPPPVAAPENDLVLKTRAQELVAPVLGFAKDARFREVVTDGVARRFDGDDNVLLSDVIADAERTGAISPAAPAWQAFKAKVASFANVGGQAYHPQLFIPNHGDGAKPGTDIVATIFESDLSRKAVPAYKLDAAGNLSKLPQLVDEAYSEANEVWVLSLNERVDLPAADFAALRDLDAEGLTARTPAAAARELGAQATCNPTGLRNNKGLEYLNWFKVPDPAAAEHWLSGKLEPRMIVVGQGGVEVKNAVFGKIKRKTIRNGVNTDMFQTTWDRAVWGDYLAYKWVEIDGGPRIELSLGLGVNILKLIKADLGVKAIFEKKTDDLGAGVVTFGESTHITYNAGNIQWRVCSMGGEGGTGDDNLARAATTSASSSYPGYAPGKVNDGSRSTELGGEHSWSNADKFGPNGLLPQWVQLDFGVNKQFSRAVVHTTASYPIRDFDVQVWNGTTWVTVATRNGNTASSVTLTFAPRNARLVRIFGRSGPNHQVQHVRVNEFEVYAS